MRILFPLLLPCLLVGTVARGASEPSPLVPKTLPQPVPQVSAPQPIDFSRLEEKEPPDAESDKAYKSAFQWLNRGKQYDAVIASMESLVRLHPSNPRYLEVLGAAYLAQALEQGAAALPDAAANRRTRPSSTTPYDLFLRGTQRIEEAVQIQPNVPDFYVTLGWAYLANLRIGIDRDSEKSGKRALEAFSQAVKLNPEEPAYWQALGDLYRLDPRLEKANAPASASAPKKAATISPEKDAASKTASPDAPSAKTTDTKTSETNAAPKTPKLPSPGMEAYRRASAARPSDAGLHFLLYQLYDRRGNKASALQELKLAQQYQPANAVPLYLLALDAFQQADEERVTGQGSDAEERAIAYLKAAHGAGAFSPDFYQPAYPSLLAPALRKALGDTLPSQTLEIYDHLKRTSEKAIVLGDVRQAGGDPAGAEEMYGLALEVGQRLVTSAMGAGDRYLLHLPELSSGLSMQELALSSLRGLYDKYAMTDRLQWMQAQQLDLDRIRQIVAQGADAASP